MNVTTGVYVFSVALVGLINVLPVIGMLGADRLQSAYGIALDSPELEILLRHRALLFGLIGGFVLVSLRLPQYQGAALTLAGCSMAGFLLLALTVGSSGESLRGILVADVLGLAALAIATVLKLSLPCSELS